MAIRSAPDELYRPDGFLSVYGDVAAVRPFGQSRTLEREREASGPYRSVRKTLHGASQHVGDEHPDSRFRISTDGDSRGSGEGIRVH